MVVQSHFRSLLFVRITVDTAPSSYGEVWDHYRAMQSGVSLLPSVENALASKKKTILIPKVLVVRREVLVEVELTMGSQAVGVSVITSRFRDCIDLLCFRLHVYPESA